MSSLIHDVVCVIKKTEKEIISGKCILALTSHITTDLIRLPAVLQARRHHHRGPPVIGKRAEELKLAAYLDDLQYLADIADKVIALKIIHNTDETLQGAISLQPFRSLKYLELKKLPLHLLTGLSNLRGQLECLVCSRSVQDLDLLLRKCGGDSSQGFPWSLLRTLICTDCDMEDLDSTLNLTPWLHVLDLSRNAISECGDAFRTLDNLTTVNLGHNQIAKIPRFSALLSGSLKILGLRNNRLESIEGIEDLENLRELDLADNCIADHRLLWPLARLFQLTRLNLQGNPISHHTKHRIFAIQYLHPRVIANSRFLLDGTHLTRFELAAVSEYPSVVRPSVNLGRSSSPIARNLSSVSLESVHAETSSQSFQDNMSASGVSSSAKRRPIRVRTVKLKDDANSPETTALILPTAPLDVLSSSTSSAFTTDIEERRQRFGEEWLKFQAAHEPSPSMPIVTNSHIEQDTFLATAGREAHSPNSPDNSQSNVLSRADSSADQAADLMETDENESSPYLVQPYGDSDPSHALLITIGEIHLIERNVSGVVKEMLELGSVLKAELDDTDPRTVALYFDYLRKDRRRRRYTFESEEQAREFLDLAGPLTEKKDEKMPCYKCLQCNEVFPEYRAETIVKYVARGDFQHSGYSSSVGSASTKGALSESAACPFCNSEMLVQHKSAESSASVTPEEESSPSPSSPITTSSQMLRASPLRERSNSVVILNSEPSYQDETILPHSLRSPFRELVSPMAISRSSAEDEEVLERQDSSEETLFAVESVEAALQTLRTKWSKAVASDQVEWHYDDYRVVDHRLRLHIDMHVLTDSAENFCLLARVGFVGTPSKIIHDALIVVSNLRIYVCRISGATSEEPAKWMRGVESIFLRDLNLIESVCERECLRLGCADGSFRMVLFRDRARCSLFSQQLEDVLTANKVSFLLRETNDMTDLESWLATVALTVDDGEPSFSLRLRTMCLLGKAPVTVLCTGTHVVLAKEECLHLVRTGKSAVTLVAAKSISAVSCLVAYQDTPTRISLKFFDEDPDNVSQWEFHFETMDGLELFVQAIREPWEEVFHVPLNVELHPVQSN